jgi:UDP-N-acetylmuramyl tripeptide synthase
LAVDFVDSRRLTGANVHARAPGAVLELRFRAGDDPTSVTASWQSCLRAGLDALGWTAQPHVRRFVDAEGREGAELMFTAEVDRLYAATDLNEWALACALGQLSGERAAARLVEIAATARAEQAARRGAVELVAAARARGVMCLIDDEQLSLGQFADVQVWPVGALPDVHALDWSSFHRRPLALITGTNGKTTTTRLLARILRKHGLRVGNTSTDGMCVDEQLVEAGDWTGPGGARAIVRNTEIDVALLEAARGGLLRRGVGVPRADVAVITNVTRDHLGEYGVFDLAGMAEAKGVVATVDDREGRVVLGADSPALLDWARGRELAAPIVWFSLDPSHPVLRDALARGGEIWTVVDGGLARCEGESVTRLCAIEDMPLSLGGRARHNVANALAAAAAARGLGVSDHTIAAALREFGSAVADNPGRAGVWVLAREDGRELRVLLDFAHNLAGLAAIAELVRGLIGDSLVAPAICFGMPGDRSDEELRELGAALTQFDPGWVILREQPHYLRGRKVGEVPALLEQGLRAADFTRISRATDEPASIEQGIEAGAELIVMLVHTQHEAVARWLQAHGAWPDSTP